MLKFRIHLKAKIDSKSLRSKSTAVTGSTNSKSTTETMPNTDTATNSNSSYPLSKSKVQTNLIETTDSVKKEDKNNSNKLEVVVEVNEEKKSEESKSSGNNNWFPNYEEIHESAEEFTKRLQNYKFRTDPTFIKTTNDFVKKLATLFLSKDRIEWTSFINLVHNLFTQHLGRITKKNKYLDIDKETNREYFLYFLDYIKEKQFFEGEMFELWKKK